MPVPSAPYSVLLADLNEDGYLDLAAVLPGASAVAVLLGMGDGSLAPPTLHPAASRPWEAAAADLNGDGHLDLVVAGDGASVASILLGRGDGSFQEKRDVPTIAGTGAVVVGDLNTDGRADLVFASTSLDAVIVLLGDGGGFDPPVSSPTGINPVSVALADLDGDGYSDVATADAGHTIWGWSLSVLLGRGDGSFGPPASFAATPWPISIAGGDLDTDGTPDLVLASEGSGALTILMGNGDGTFRASSGDAGRDAGCLAIADFDLDGRLDLAVPNRGPHDTVSVLLGTGDGSFSPAQGFPAGSAPRAAAAGDLNLDGWPDLVTANLGTGSVSVLLNNTQVVSAEAPGTSRRVSLLGSYPNPARERTAVRFAAATDGRIDLRVYDMAGRLVRTLMSGAMPAGRHAAGWDLRTSNGSRAAPGVYVIELRAAARRLNAKVVVLP